MKEQNQLDYRYLARKSAFLNCYYKVFL